MTATFDQLQEIARYAALDMYSEVKTCLANGVPYREALLYIEAFHQASNARSVLIDCSFCKCGELAIRFTPKQMCANCSLHEKLQQIEYSN